MGTGFKAKMSLAAIGAALALTAAVPAQAVTFVGLYDTGVNNADQVRAAGNIDNNYKISFTDNVNLLPIPLGGAPAYIVNNGPWSPNDAVGSLGSNWISPFIDTADNNNPGPSTSFDPLTGPPFIYDYLLNFDIGAVDPNNAFISGNVQSDNLVQIYLNNALLPFGGQPVVPPPGDTTHFQSFTAFGTASGFNAGPNTLRFRVIDYGVVTGLRVDGLIGGDSAIPEPGVWAMMIIGFGLVAGQIRRRRRTGSYAIA